MERCPSNQATRTEQRAQEAMVRIKANALADVLKEHPGKIIDLGK